MRVGLARAAWSAFSCGLAACTPSEETADSTVWGGADTATNADCSLGLTARFSSDSAPTWDTCVAQESAAKFEFASDAPPSLRTLDLTLFAANALNETCSINLRFPSLCGLGTYTVEAARAGVTLGLSDCARADEFARVYVADAGSVSIEAMSAGSQTGQLSGISLPLFVQGSFAVSEDTVSFTGTFRASTDIIAEDAGTAGCAEPG